MPALGVCRHRGRRARISQRRAAKSAGHAGREARRAARNATRQAKWAAKEERRRAREAQQLAKKRAREQKKEQPRPAEGGGRRRRRTGDDAGGDGTQGRGGKRARTAPAPLDLGAEPMRPLPQQPQRISLVQAPFVMRPLAYAAAAVGMPGGGPSPGLGLLGPGGGTGAGGGVYTVVRTQQRQQQQAPGDYALLGLLHWRLVLQPCLAGVAAPQNLHALCPVLRCNMLWRGVHATDPAMPCAPSLRRPAYDPASARPYAPCMLFATPLPLLSGTVPPPRPTPTHPQTQMHTARRERRGSSSDGSAVSSGDDGEGEGGHRGGHAAGGTAAVAAVPVRQTRICWTPSDDRLVLRTLVRMRSEEAPLKRLRLPWAEQAASLPRAPGLCISRVNRLQVSQPVSRSIIEPSSHGSACSLQLPMAGSTSGSTSGGRTCAPCVGLMFKGRGKCR